MKRNYKTPVSEMLVFDYTESVVASGPTQYKSTQDHKCVVIIEEPKLFSTPTTVCKPQ